jgi:hypothetical protein
MLLSSLNPFYRICRDEKDMAVRFDPANYSNDATINCTADDFISAPADIFREPAVYVATGYDHLDVDEIKIVVRHLLQKVGNTDLIFSACDLLSDFIEDPQTTATHRRNSRETWRVVTSNF